MNKRWLLALIVLFVVWSVLDFVIHGVLLKPSYEATANLWRPMNEMNMPLISFVTFVFTACFLLIYGLFVSNKSVTIGIKFGLLFGLASGVTMGFGSYSYMPIPLALAWSWFFGTLLQLVVAGGIVGVMVKE